MKSLLTRLKIFIALVWRPSAGEDGDTWIKAWFKYRISIKTAWEISRILTREYQCYCGTGATTPHYVGTQGCVREIVNAPRPTKEGDWEVEEGEEFQTISEYTMKQQRGFEQHECGGWSRWPRTTNSLPDET